MCCTPKPFLAITVTANSKIPTYFYIKKLSKYSFTWDNSCIVIKKNFSILSFYILIFPFQILTWAFIFKEIQVNRWIPNLHALIVDDGININEASNNTWSMSAERNHSLLALSVQKEWHKVLLCISTQGPNMVWNYLHPQPSNSKAKNVCI